MIVKGIWIVFLPLTFHIGNEFKKTTLSNFRFELNGASCELLQNHENNTIDRIKLVIEDHYSHEHLPAHENFDYMSEFERRMSFTVSKTVQDFLDGFSKSTNSVYYQIFDGRDFITKYSFEIQPNICSGSSGGDEIERGIYLDDKDLESTIAFASKEKSFFDNAWFYLRDAEHLIEVGKFEIALINLANMLEFLVKVQLRDLLDDNGRFKDKQHKDKIIELFGQDGNPSFADKYYNYGLKLIGGLSLPKELLDTVDLIYKTRNKLAHGYRLNETKLISENEVLDYNYHLLLHSLLNDCIELYNYFHDLQNRNT